MGCSGRPATQAGSRCGSPGCSATGTTRPPTRRTPSTPCWRFRPASSRRRATEYGLGRRRPRPVSSASAPSQLLTRTVAAVLQPPRPVTTAHAHHWNVLQPGPVSKRCTRALCATAASRRGNRSHRSPRMHRPTLRGPPRRAERPSTRLAHEPERGSGRARPRQLWPLEGPPRLEDRQIPRKPRA